VASGLDQCASRVYLSTGGSGSQLVVREISFRSPSEHTIQGKLADAEVQVVMTRQGVVASVAAVLLQVNPPWLARWAERKQSCAASEPSLARSLG
jgi:carbonic anhydrase